MWFNCLLGCNGLIVMIVIAIFDGSCNGKSVQKCQPNVSAVCEITVRDEWTFKKKDQNDDVDSGPDC